jgi:GT2 family glycosyltransferase
MKAKNVKIGVIILTMNQKEDTLRCLEGLRNVKSSSFKVLLWDNGSKDGTAEAIRKAFPEVLVHYHSRNVGVASGRNKAAKIILKEFNPRFLLFVDNDMTFSPGFLDALMAPFEHISSLAQTTGKICDIKDHRRLYGAGGYRIRFWRGDTMHVGFRETDYGQYDRPRKCYPSGGCMLVRSEVYQKLGGFDPLFNPYGCEDLDFGLRARKAGYYGLYVPQAVVYHETKPDYSFEGREHSAKLARHWSKHWFLLMKRHSPLWQKLIFLMMMAPFLLFRMTFREYRKGNIMMLKGILSGFLAFGMSGFIRFPRKKNAVLQ